MNNKMLALAISTLLTSCCSDEQSLFAFYDSPTYEEEFNTKKCDSTQIPLIPLFHNPPDASDPLLLGINVPESFIEKDTLACRRLEVEKDATIVNVAIDYYYQQPCTEKTQFYYAIGDKDQTTSLSWSEGMTFPLENIIQIPVKKGEVFYGCAKLKIKDVDNRACILSCEDGYDPDSFWANTDDVTGLIKNPYELESLAISPNEKYAKEWNNDQRRIAIYFSWTQKNK